MKNSNDLSDTNLPQSPASAAAAAAAGQVLMPAFG